MAISPRLQASITRLNATGSGDGGFARAKKLADLEIKTNTVNGVPTAVGYEKAIAILEPYTGAEGNRGLDAQRLVAQYSNNLVKFNEEKSESTGSAAFFKQEEEQAYFTTVDTDIGSFRDPNTLVNAISLELDNVVLGVINAIDEKEAMGKPTTELKDYLDDLNKRADKMRDLNNRFQSGQLKDQSLDGFGYYVETNPLDGTIRKAGILPSGALPDSLTSGYRRIEATANLKGGLLPVYVPAEQASDGTFIARVGDAVWSGTSGDGALQKQNADKALSLFNPGEFDISNAEIFSARNNSLSKGQFGRGVVGKDAEGKLVEAYVYRGVDNKIYQVDKATEDSFRQDPILAKKLDTAVSYVPRFSPAEMRQLVGQSVPFDPSRLGRESKIAGLQEEVAAAQADEAQTEGVGSFFKNAARAVTVGAVNPVPGVSSFFGNKNTPNQPETSTPARTAADIVDKGKSFFKSAVSAILPG